MTRITTGRIRRGAAAFCAALLCLPLAVLPLSAAELTPRAGWAVHDSGKDFPTLLEDLKAAVRAHKMGLVTEAGPTGAAKARGITIPGNRVVGVFRNDYAVAILGLSTAAMIEAPLRFYVTEDADHSATLAYKIPSEVFAPYTPEAGPKLAGLAAELDAIFAEIAKDALR